MSAPVLSGFAVEDLAPVAAVAAHEGPVYVAAEDAVYFTTVPRGRADGARVVAIGRLGLRRARSPSSSRTPMRPTA